MPTKYMHTMDGRPAFFSRADKLIFFAGGRQRIRLADSLNQIREEQKICRERELIVIRSFFRYDYVLVDVPDRSKP